MFATNLQWILPTGRRLIGQGRRLHLPCRAGLTALLLGAVCLVNVLAATPADKFAKEIRRYDELAAAARETLAARLGDLNDFPVFKKVDGPLITKHLEAVSQTWAEAARALEEGNETAAAALARRAEELAGQRGRWEQRLNWRRLQAQHEYLPATAKVFFMLATERNGDLEKEVGAFLEAKRRRSEAYGRLAEATTPAADDQILFKLQDEVFALDVEVGVADMKYGWAREDWDFHRWVVTDPKVISLELRAAQERLTEWRHQREQTYRQSRNEQHELERLDREREALLKARENAYRTAKAARNSSGQSSER